MTETNQMEQRLAMQTLGGRTWLLLKWHGRRVLWMLALLCTAVAAQAQSCQITNVSNNGTFDFLPYTISANATASGVSLLGGSTGTIGYVDQDGVFRSNAGGGNRWVNSSSATTNISLTFATPIPASWLAFVIVDLGNGTGGAYAPNMQLSLSGDGNTATPADFYMTDAVTQGTVSQLRLAYDPATGVIRKVSSGNGSIRESGALVGSSSNLVRTLTFSASGLRTNDDIAFFALAIPTCVSVDKISNGNTGTFGFTTSNLVASDGSPATSTSVTTTTAGTAASSGPFYVANNDAVVTLSETADSAWTLTSAVCTDANAAESGNSGQFGTLAGNQLTIPIANLVPNADIHCTFSNRGRSADVQVVKSASSSSVVSGEVVTYTLVASNNGPDDIQDVVLTDTPASGLDCSQPSTTATCQAANGATCPGATVAVSDLSSTGIIISNLPVAGQVTITLQCTVTANGLP